MDYLEFYDKDYTPQKTDLICTFRVEPIEEMPMIEAAARVASESSIGTWTKSLNTETKNKDRLMGLRGIVFEINEDLIKVAYPLDLWEEGNMPQILSGIAGNVFGMRAVKNLRLEDAEFPKELVASFPGPQFGIEGVRKLFDERTRPITATVVKPKLGLTTDEHCEAGYKAWIGGIDLLKDDENLTSQVFNRFEDRVTQSLQLREKAESETGEKKSYLINITAETREMLKRAKFVKDHGGEYVMIDIITIGFAAFQTVREECEDLGLAIHCHRAMHAAFDRNPKHGMSMKMISRITRMIGGDQLHTGTANIGKLESIGNETQEINEFLQSPWFGKKTVFPVPSGGVHPGTIPAVIETLGNDVVIQCGGGLWGHPRGYIEGAKAIRQAIDASMNGIDVNEYAKTHTELRQALDQWGSETPV